MLLGLGFIVGWGNELGIYCIVKGFRPSALAATYAHTDRIEPTPAAAPA